MNMPYNMYNNSIEQNKSQTSQVERQTTWEAQKQKQKGQNFKQNNYNETKKESIHDLSDNRESCSDEKPIFEIFGIKLFFDDILIIALIFFLYDEGVTDNLLFISLILLLLS